MGRIILVLVYCLSLHELRASFPTPSKSMPRILSISKRGRLLAHSFDIMTKYVICDTNYVLSVCASCRVCIKVKSKQRKRRKDFLSIFGAKKNMPKLEDCVCVNRFHVSN